jgi:AAA+ superfamily predicted ATPase
MGALRLNEYRHPDKLAHKRFDALIGIHEHKEQLLFALRSILDTKGLEGWLKKFHPKGLPYLEKMLSNDPLVLLSGDVGCGKTELAHSVASPLSDLMGGESIVLFETPSDIRGGGHVGELSSRITAAFDYAKHNIKKGEYGILLIDEADDLVTSRDQMQAHHEDRSGVNVVIKEVDKLSREKAKLAVVMITNRLRALDPAVVRRASLQLKFERPGKDTLRNLIERVFEGILLKEKDVEEVVEACLSKPGAYTYSDITKRIGKQCMISGWRTGTPVTRENILTTIKDTEPSPIITEFNRV